MKRNVTGIRRIMSFSQGMVQFDLSKYIEINYFAQYPSFFLYGFKKLRAQFFGALNKHKKIVFFGIRLVNTLYSNGG